MNDDCDDDDVAEVEDATITDESFRELETWTRERGLVLRALLVRGVWLAELTPEDDCWQLMGHGKSFVQAVTRVRRRCKAMGKDLLLIEQAILKRAGAYNVGAERPS